LDRYMANLKNEKGSNERHSKRAAWLNKSD
jgi:hypothetical protein